VDRGLLVIVNYFILEMDTVKKCIVAEFIGLWGYAGKKKEGFKTDSDAKKLFAALVT
jgi:hypothetical protein